MCSRSMKGWLKKSSKDILIWGSLWRSFRSRSLHCSDTSEFAGIWKSQHRKYIIHNQWFSRIFPGKSRCRFSKYICEGTCMLYVDSGSYVIAKGTLVWMKVWQEPNLLHRACYATYHFYIKIRFELNKEKIVTIEERFLLHKPLLAPIKLHLLPTLCWCTHTTYVPLFVLGQEFYLAVLRMSLMQREPFQREPLQPKQTCINDFLTELSPFK